MERLLCKARTVAQVKDKGAASPVRSWREVSCCPGWHRSAGATSIVALANLNEKGRNPWFNMQYRAAMTENEVLRMPAHVKDYRLMGTSAIVKNYTFHANDEDNDINAAGWGTDITVYLGPGDDRFSAARGKTVVYGDEGDDHITLGNSAGSAGYGGTGNDTIIAGTGNNQTLDGGTGNDIIFGGPGNDTLIGGSGNDMLIVTGGSHLLTGGADADTFRIMRTGQVQTISDMAPADTLDLSDWVGIQPVTITQVGADAVVTAALERIVCLNSSAATVAPRIIGVTVNA